MDLEEDGSAVGQYLRIKVRLNITKPLMRGVSLVVEEGENPLWCPMVYEYLPDFCFICGIIGHIDKTCAQRGEGDNAPQFSRKLRFMPEKKRWEEGFNGGGSFSRRSGSWRSSGSGEVKRIGGEIKTKESGRSASLSWRKDEEAGREEPEVQSPLKKFIPPQRRERGGKSASQNLEKKIQNAREKPDERAMGTASATEKTGLLGRDVAMGGEVVEKVNGDEKVQETRKKGKYKKLAREQEGKSDGKELKITGG